MDTDNEQEQPAKKKKGRKKVESYAPKEHHLALFRLLMDGVYRTTYQVAINDTVVYYDKELFRKPEGEDYILWNSLDIVASRPLEYKIYTGSYNEDGMEVSDYYFRSLNMKDIESQIFENKMIPFKEDISDDEIAKKKEKAYSTFYKTLNDFTEDKGFFVKTLVAGHKMYYPNESIRAFERFVKMLYIVTKGIIDEKYSFLFSTSYFRMCLTKQFVLDCLSKHLWEKGYYASLQLPTTPSVTDYDLPEDIAKNTTGIQRFFRTPLPILGRYPKVYEDKDTNMKFVRFIRKAESYFMSLDRVSVSILENHFFGTEIDNSEFVMDISDELKERMKLSIDKLCSDLEYDMRIKEKLGGDLDHYCDKIYDDYSKGSLTDVVEVFNADPGGTYRCEDPWAGIVLTDEDINTLRKTSEVYVEVQYDRHTEDECGDEKKSYIEKCTMPVFPREEDYGELIDMYPTIVDSLVIPLISLMRFSPNALFHFLFNSEKWFKECTEDYERNRSFQGDGTPRLFDVNRLVESLTKIALKDYLNGMSIRGGDYPTRCVHAGNLMGNGRHFPSVLTFGLGEDNVMALAWSEEVPKSTTNSEPAFIPYFDKIPCYSQHLVDIVKMPPSRASSWRDFLVKSLVEHDAEWRKIADDDAE